ncbi:MAG: hypothetical protein CMI23_06605, partial [Opitutae bacterium]|nr:hypothetical protein [Opitutae bacterium]
SNANPVVQVINDKSKEVQYTVRVQGKNFQPKVYSLDPHSVKLGKNIPNTTLISGFIPVPKQKEAKSLKVDPYL